MHTHHLYLSIGSSCNTLQLLTLCFSSLSPLLLSVRYYGIAIVNSAGKKLKLAKGSVTVTYQIHR